MVEQLRADLGFSSTTRVDATRDVSVSGGIIAAATEVWEGRCHVSGDVIHALRVARPKLSLINSIWIWNIPWQNIN